MLAALSGGADSLALAAAIAYEAPKAGMRAGAVIVDHGLQSGSAAVAARAAASARGLGLDPVIVRRVDVDGAGETGDGPEAAARSARYAAFAEVAGAAVAAGDVAGAGGARAILTAHTRDDQAEQVLLGLARGSGTRSLAGIPPVRRLTARCVILRPFLVSEPEITRAITEAACAQQGLEYWRDPHNTDPAYARVRVRSRVLPLLERELGPGVAAALARTADLAREDADAFDTMVDEQVEEIVAHSEAGISVSVAALAANPAALRHRMIRRIAHAEFGSQLSREHTLQIAALSTDWRGQGALHLPGIRVHRERGRIVFARHDGSPRVADHGRLMEE